MVSGTAIGIATLSGSIFPMFMTPKFGSFIDKYGDTGYKYIFMVLIGVCVLGILNAMWAGAHNKKCLEGRRKMNLAGLEGAEQ